ncbi:MAG: hypothetical protein K9H16_06025 [Bacteroidales bacterium]|nr:hypothetical protein [Bacteroidales bacterium]
MTVFNNLTLAAKIRWRMKYDRNPLLTQLQDKLAVKKYAAQRGVPSTEVLFVTQNPETIPFGDLPEKCFIKANHGRNWNILKNGENYVDFKGGQKLISTNGFYDLASKTQKYLNLPKINEMCTKWLNTIYCTTEWAYLNIPPAIFVETLIEP